MTQTAIGTYLLETTDQAAKMMSRLEVAFGIGALFMPIVTGILIAKYDWIWSFAIVAVAAFINMLFWTRNAMTAGRNKPMKTMPSVSAAYQDTTIEKAPLSASLLRGIIKFPEYEVYRPFVNHMQ